MEIIRTIPLMQSKSRQIRREGKTIGFVPTMGYLHEGHLSLIRIARKRADVVVVSIFVNPTQFGPNEDYDRYPRDFERDRKLCEKEGVDIIFAPSVEEMYPPDDLKNRTYVDIDGEMTKVLCGKYRPGHFRGVMTVVAKLFNIVQPDFAVFGQKDGQQLAVIRKMVKDLNFPIEIVAGPTVREPDGLAMSSRNEYLSPEERKVAPAIYKALVLGKTMIENGERDAKKVVAAVREFLENSGPFKVQYVEIVDADTMEILDKIRGRVMIATAVFLGNTRLIDNVVVEVAD